MLEISVEADGRKVIEDFSNDQNRFRNHAKSLEEVLSHVCIDCDTKMWRFKQRPF
jgi:hypothetical protein